MRVSNEFQRDCAEGHIALTYIVLVGRRDGIDELIWSQEELSRLGILDRMAVEASLGLG